ncbi:hypothetical protein [Paraburkholderia mimosarum]|uniref:hypothetical protein n=1 Tax=Paraburkholderia mimosarum TaxID=312026 RepID=UPI0004848F55|nr:hypothetical protein [Paraburkholderia mimosarum]
MNKHRKDVHLRDDEKPPVHEREVVINVARTVEALRGPFVAMPVGLTREEKRKFILSHAK